MTVLTFYALLGSELNKALFTKTADFPFEVMNSLAMLAFFAEFYANTVCKTDYKWSFFCAGVWKPK